MSFDDVKYRENTNTELVQLGIHAPAASWKYDYPALIEHLDEIRHKRKKEFNHLVREVGDNDLWFFMYYVLNMPIAHPYLVNKAYLLQEHVNDPYLYLAAGRGCWKSTFLTIGMSIWETALDCNLTTVILSYERQMAIKQLRGVKRNVENNLLLSQCWPETFYSSDDFRAKRTEKWNEYDGLFVRRKLTSSDPTWAGYGFIEGIPTGTHFRRLIIDDPVTLDNVATVESIQKVDDGFRMLTGIKDKVHGSVTRVVTTRYDVNDLSKTIIEDARYKHIIIPAEVNAAGKAQFDSIPVYLTREQLDDERLNYGDAKYAAQMLQNPTLGGGAALDMAWLDQCIYTERPENLLYYILCDPAGSKTKKSDYCVYAVIGVSSNKQFFLVDMIRDRLDVYERFEKLKELHQQYKPDGTHYEIQALNSDLEVFEREMRACKYYMNIEKFSCNIARSKDRRIVALGAMFRKREMLIPETLWYDGRDLIEEFINEEYSKYPNNRSHDDMLDAMSMITQVPVTLPEPKPEDKKVNYPALKWGNPLESKPASGGYLYYW